ncbi:MAG TPA: tetratricopeptide repeat protein [Methanomicrobiales archaeon]|nr:tetratricopeptide repeat protein [Methanomicrobiales archaeon]
MLDHRMPGEVFRKGESSDRDRGDKVGVLPISPPNDADYLYEVSLELSDAGKFESAIDLLTKALILRPQFPVAWYQKGVCQVQLDKVDDALASYDTCLNHDPYHAEAWFNRGMLLKKQGQHEEGDRSVKRAIDLCLGR